ncbi:MAG: trypsin-like serine protease [Myxococcales bacterium]
MAMKYNSGGIGRARLGKSGWTAALMGVLVATAEMLGAGACDSRHDPTPSKSDQNIIAGFAANSPVLDAMGSLVIHFDTPPPGFTLPPSQELCGATLVAPETVLTAKHCALIVPFITSIGGRLTFAVGPDSARPKWEVNIVATELAPGDVGGFVGVGHDVAVMHLESPITGIVPVAIAELSDEQIGQPFAAIGYGVQDNTGAFGTRRLGTQTLRSRQGRVFETMFDNFENFFEWFQTGAVPGDSDNAGLAGDAGVSDGDGGMVPPPPPSRDGAPPPPVRDGAPPPPPPPPPTLEEIARQIYETTLLDEGYEVVTGGAPGDAQPCFGDSGSSLIRRHDGQFVSFGVVSGGLGSRDSICDMGTVYATFGPGVREFVDRANQWVDPCGNLDSRGTCDGNSAVRCTNLLEGRRRLVSFDCGALDMTCNTSGGQVSCDDSPFAPPSPPSRPAGAPGTADLRQQADKVFMNAAALAARHSQQ